MLYYDRIDLSEEVDIDKTNSSKDCDICHYWCFLNKGLNFQPYISNIKNADYRCIINRIIKSEATDKSKT